MLHAISHKVALYFVAPVGGAAVATNFLQHRNPLVLLWGLTGLSFVLLANVHLAFLHTRWLPPPLPAREGGHPLARLEASPWQLRGRLACGGNSGQAPEAEA